MGSCEQDTLSLLGMVHSISELLWDFSKSCRGRHKVELALFSWEAGPKEGQQTVCTLPCARLDVDHFHRCCSR